MTVDRCLQQQCLPCALPPTTTGRLRPFGFFCFFACLASPRWPCCWACALLGLHGHKEVALTNNNNSNNNDGTDMGYRGCCVLSAGDMCIVTVWLHLRVWRPSQIERNHKHMREDWICTLLGMRVASLHSGLAHLPCLDSISIGCTHMLPRHPTPFLRRNCHAG